MKEYMVNYHFADGNKIGRLMNAHDDESALRHAVPEATNPVLFTNSKGVLHYFRFDDVLYVTVYENKSRTAQVKGF